MENSEETASESYIECNPFLVDDTPYCLWDTDIKQKNSDFINSIDATYFQHSANIHAAFLESEQRQYAAIALRTEYYHSLETLFAFICATVQAPDCVIGWLLKYQNSELTSAVRKIQNRRPIRHRMNVDHLTWESIAAKVNPFDTGDAEKNDLLRQSFGRLWRRFAKDFLDDEIKDEYNSIKHGLRVGMGGFSFALGIEATPGVSPPPGAMRLLEKSEFGSSFFVAKHVQDQEKPQQKQEKPRLNRENFRPMHHQLNWHPGNLVNALYLISASIQNVINYLKFINGIQQSDLLWAVPEDETIFDKPWELPTRINKFSRNDLIDENSIIVLSKEDIKATYDAGLTEK